MFKIILCICILFFSTLTANAANHSLTGIDVNSDLKNGYNIVLKLAGNTKVKKITKSSDNLTLILNSTIPSENLEIIYENTSKLNNVIVQKKNQDNTIISLEGKNISNSNIYTKDILTGNLTSLNSEKFLFGLNKKLFMFLLFIPCFLFIKYRLRNMKHKTFKYKKIYKEISENRLNSILYSKTAPSIAYNRVNSYISAPKDFVINHYMHEDKIKKAC